MRMRGYVLPGQRVRGVDLRCAFCATSVAVKGVCDSADVRYGSLPAARILLCSMFGVFSIVAVVLAVQTIRGADGFPLAFTVLWVGAAGWNAYWWLFRIAAELRVDDDVLTSSSPLRVRRVAIAQVREVRPMRLASNVAVFDIVGERPLLTVARKGLREFTDELERRRPGLQVRLGWQARLSERMPGRSGTRRS